jgi:hypothetical protein
MKQSSVNIMSEQEIINITGDQEKEIDNILIDSALYREMSPAERQKLLCYLVASYFNFLPVKNRRALPTAMQTGSAM